VAKKAVALVVEAATKEKAAVVKKPAKAAVAPVEVRAEEGARQGCRQGAAKKTAISRSEIKRSAKKAAAEIGDKGSKPGLGRCCASTRGARGFP
jgi:hypothetical protein